MLAHKLQRKRAPREMNRRNVSTDSTASTTATSYVIPTNVPIKATHLSNARTRRSTSMSSTYGETTGSSCSDTTSSVVGSSISFSTDSENAGTDSSSSYATDVFARPCDAADVADVDCNNKKNHGKRMWRWINNNLNFGQQQQSQYRNIGTATQNIVCYAIISFAFLFVVFVQTLKLRYNPVDESTLTAQIKYQQRSLFGTSLYNPSSNIRQQGTFRMQAASTISSGASRNETAINKDDEVATSTRTLLQKYRDILALPQSVANLNPNISAREPIGTIAYAISLIQCSNFQSSPAGLLDAAIVLRHSIHMASIRNPKSTSKYDYKMYAIVHPKAIACSKALQDVGYELLIREPPITKDEIQDEYLRNNIHRARCCGADEFVKLYAYTITNHPIVVHLDIDFLFVQPIDHLYDAMLYPKNSTMGHNARNKIEIEYNKVNTITRLQNMDQIDAFYTKDYPGTVIGRKAGYQAGFVVLRPDIKTFETIVNVIRTERYVGGVSRQNGWGGSGHGLYTGAMAMQGLIAYIYDYVLPNNTIELNQCRHNHMGVSNWMTVSHFFVPAKNQCHNGSAICEDCTITDLKDIYTVHYTGCQKPWLCPGKGSYLPLPEHFPLIIVTFEHCTMLHSLWHSIRSDFEHKLRQLILTSSSTYKETALIKANQTIDGIRNGTYMDEIFNGHCTGFGNTNYISITNLDKAAFHRINEIYLVQ